jgi:hypothetical protein
VDSEGRAKLVGFGLPARAGDAGSATVQTDLRAVTATYRECLAGAAASPLRFGSLDDAPAFLAELTTAAANAYGPDWEARGRELLAGRAARLLGVSAPQERPTPSPTPPDAAPGWDNRVLLGVAVALVVAAAFASLVAR